MTAQQTPTPGRIVLVTINEGQAKSINGARTQAGIATKTGNTARAGDVFPMIIVRVWDDRPDASVNGQIILDGNDSLWATSIPLASSPEQQFAWRWPERA